MTESSSQTMGNYQIERLRLKMKSKNMTWKKKSVDEMVKVNSAQPQKEERLTTE